MNSDKKILLIEFCNYEDYPIGGLLTFCKNLMTVCDDELVLVGITTSKEDPIGKWFKKGINGINYDFLALARYEKSKTKHFVPDRLALLGLLKWHKKTLLEKKIHNVFIQRQEILIAIKDYGYKNICYCFAGLENPLEFSKYWYAHYFANIFYQSFLTNLAHVKVLLAAGDDKAIEELIQKSKGKIARGSVIKFPTRIDTKIFKSKNRCEIRKKLGVPDATKVISTTGRLSAGKGWKFMIDSYAEFEKKYPDSLFFFIGEGEDRDSIKNYVTAKSFSKNIILAGRKSQVEIADYLNASDLFIMGSYKEGWSTTLLEALACGVPICTTNFSSAKDVVTEGISGYVVEVYDPVDFAKKMEDALLLDRSKLPIKEEVLKYSVSELRTDLLDNWKLI